MPDKCCIPKCRTSNSMRLPNTSIYRFPKDEEMRKKWLAVIPRKNLKIRKTTRVCALHFNKSDFVTEASAYDPKTSRRISYKLDRTRLKTDAVPSNFPSSSENFSNTRNSREDPEKRRIRLENKQLQLAMKESLVENSMEGQSQFENAFVPTLMVAVNPTAKFQQMNFVSEPSRSWTKDEVTALIALYQSEKCLYDRNHVNYHNCDENNKAYQRIQNILRNICPDCTIPEIENEISSLHYQYVSEKLYKDYNIKAGLTTEDTYAPEMWCFGFLQFLDDHIVQQDVREIKVEPTEDYQNEIATSSCVDFTNIKIEVLDPDPKQQEQNQNLNFHSITNHQNHEVEVDKEYNTENLNSEENCQSNKDNEKELNNELSVTNKMFITNKICQDSGKREHTFGKYIASEMRTLKDSPLLYLKTKQAIIDILTSASFELINPE